MDLTLTRTRFSVDGIYGELTGGDDEINLVTLEHGYARPMGYPRFLPKLPEGIYTCKRGMHQLEGMKAPFETFEIENVPGHTDILFHVGNFNKDSAGCVLVGLVAGDAKIVCSREAFQRLLKAQVGLDTFQLTVQNSL